MPRLREHDLRGVLAVLADVYAAGSLDAFTRQVNAGLRRLIPSDIVGWNEINPRARRIHYVVEPADVVFPDSEHVFARHMHEHPMIAHWSRTGCGPPVKLSDFLSRRQLHDLGIYTEFFRWVDVEDLIAVTLPFRPPLQFAFHACRAGPDFTERDRLVLELLRPHLAQAYRNAEAAEAAAETARRLEAGLEQSSRGVIVLGPDGRARAMTGRARGWLREYWGAPAWHGDGVPPAVRDWVRRARSRLAGNHAAVSEPHAPLVAERRGKRLTMRLVAELVLLAEERVEPDAAALRPLGLSRREAEVLAWVAEGKTNPEIGRIAGLSARTVGKHLERVYAKLGVETRTAAARVALSLQRGLP